VVCNRKFAEGQEDGMKRLAGFPMESGENICVEVEA
jgi:hypothetical protein